MRALLIGNYGVGNFGDEALREYFLSAFPDVEWIVVSHSPFSILHSPFTPRLPFGFRSAFTPWWRTLRAMQRCDAVVFGGGSLFTDVESTQACVLWWWHAFVARICGKPVILAFQGVGPFRTRVGEWCARWVVTRAVHISVRDEKSFERVQKWREDVVLSFDPVFSLLTQATSYHSSPRLRPASKLQTANSSLVLIPRDNSTPHFFARAEKLWKSGKFPSVQILSFKPGERFPLTTGEGEGIGGARVTGIASIEDLCHALSGASFILTQRYHGAVAALALGIPFETVAQGEGDKHATIPQSKEGLLERVSSGERSLREIFSGKPKSATMN